MNYYIEVLKKYAVFSGRARRKEYWYFALFSTIISIVLGIFDGSNNVLSGIYGLAVLIPSIAVGIRRLHDIGKSGWWLFIGLIPVVGWIWIIVYLVRDSQPGENQYGANPKEAKPMGGQPVAEPAVQSSVPSSN